MGLSRFFCFEGEDEHFLAWFKTTWMSFTMGKAQICKAKFVELVLEGGIKKRTSYVLVT